MNHLKTIQPKNLSVYFYAALIKALLRPYKNELKFCTDYKNRHGFVLKISIREFSFYFVTIGIKFMKKEKLASVVIRVMRFIYLLKTINLIEIFKNLFIKKEENYY